MRRVCPFVINTETMETQLVRLDAPYDIICSTLGNLGLHIATMIVVKEKAVATNKVAMSKTLEVAEYPVVAQKNGLNGSVWMESEQKDCFKIGNQGYDVSIRMLRNLMEYCEKQNVMNATSVIPVRFKMAMKAYKCIIDIYKSQHTVKLIFEEGNHGGTCMVYADGESMFYFYEYFANEPEQFRLLSTNLEAVNHLALLRDEYLRLFEFDGLNAINFITDDKKYQWFVDKLNGIATNGEAV